MLLDGKIIPGPAPLIFIPLQHCSPYAIPSVTIGTPGNSFYSFQIVSCVTIPSREAATTPVDSATSEQFPLNVDASTLQGLKSCRLFVPTITLDVTLSDSPFWMQSKFSGETVVNISHFSLGFSC